LLFIGSLAGTPPGQFTVRRAKMTPFGPAQAISYPLSAIN
jgi:hypothetical protein